MPAFTSTYLLPAILLNPALVLHIINTFASHFMPPAPTVSVSPHPIMESLGPSPGSTLYLDMHADDRLCWGYTGVMVVLQMLAIGRVQDNRDRRRAARTAKLEKERGNKEKLESMSSERRALGLDGTDDPPLRRELDRVSNGKQEHPLTGLTRERDVDLMEESDLEERKSGMDSDTSVTETSEEEMML
ncbi:uncharacterized protein LY89DRAFT_75975 [Mollisia scopiformis]|uniref:Uncharacterized protein n=1 Tax=Mollisia scopiformis TaxID=149040 RepID=A0A194X7L5_MOLSC|nr:uncharacterized protein LY89DRAFT_75975 [Mollisia scopiformis]KUJ16158.1 hypothetical protein LY89DRAFT_75975 [Mollisia scopiformis]